MQSAVTLRLGTRGSLLAMRQATGVAEEITARNPQVRVEIVVIKTSGDRITDRPLYAEGGKGLFVKELEQSLIDHQTDMAVHSCKDLPTTMPLVDERSLVIAAMPPRFDPRDLLISLEHATIADLPEGATVATGSLRRQCQLLALRPDLLIEPIRGNIDTRVKKLRSGQIDALVLAMAGIERAGLSDAACMHSIPLEDVLSAPGQGALALQCRRDDQNTAAILASLDDPSTHQCVTAERDLVAALEADCHSPIAALAQIDGANLRLRAVVGGRDGRPPILTAAAQSPIAQYSLCVAKVHGDLCAQGVMKLLHGRQ